MSPATRGVVVVLAGFGLTIALGSLCVWVPVAVELLRPLSAGGSHEWALRQVSIPFAIAAASFVLAMVAGGALQDRIGPRWPSTAGGVLVGLGMILASMSEARLQSPDAFALFMVLGLGFMVGGGAGLTFASVVPPAVKWSVPRRRGLVVGLILAGFASGPAWINGPVQELVLQRGVSSVLMIQGIVLLTVIVGLSQLIDNPLAGYVPPGSYADTDGTGDSLLGATGMSSRRMLSTPTFWALWTCTALVGAALAILGVRLMLSLIALPAQGGVLIVGEAIAGGLGGVMVGVAHDRMGETGFSTIFATLAVALSAAAVLSSAGHGSAAAMLTAAVSVGSVVAAWVATMQGFGVRRAGTNFGLVFWGWSVGLLLGALATVVLVNVATPATTPGDRILISVTFVLVLAGAVLLASRVRTVVIASRTGEDRRTRSGELQG